MLMNKIFLTLSVIFKVTSNFKSSDHSIIKTYFRGRWYYGSIYYFLVSYKDGISIGLKIKQFCGWFLVWWLMFLLIVQYWFCNKVNFNQEKKKKDRASEQSPKAFVCFLRRKSFKDWLGNDLWSQVLTSSVFAKTHQLEHICYKSWDNTELK